jgi:hypothetical protein
MLSFLHIRAEFWFILMQTRMLLKFFCFLTNGKITCKTAIFKSVCYCGARRVKWRRIYFCMRRCSHAWYRLAVRIYHPQQPLQIFIVNFIFGPRALLVMSRISIINTRIWHKLICILTKKPALKSFRLFYKHLNRIIL